MELLESADTIEEEGNKVKNTIKKARIENVFPCFFTIFPALLVIV
jgi:hypothetical protein